MGRRLAPRLLLGDAMRQDDLEKITHQLGRPPRGVVCVAKRCLAGHPQVITTYPIYWGKGQPKIFPTLYWLTCPALKGQVGGLETEGWINRLQQRVETDDTLANKWDEAHDQYAKERVRLVPSEELALLKERYPAQAQVLEAAGVGGIRGRGIKCLHTHLAHHLADPNGSVSKPNPIGDIVAGLLRKQGITMDFCYDEEWERFCRGCGVDS